MKRFAAAAVSFVAVACARAPAPTPPVAEPTPIATLNEKAGDANAPNEVVRRIISGGEVFARLPSSCETLVVAAGKDPEQRALEIDTSEAIGCTAKRKSGILLDVTDPKRIRCTGSRHQTASRALAVVMCAIEEPRAETATPRTGEAMVSGVRLFSDRATCEGAAAPATMAREPTCFEAALAKAVDQRKDEVPKGEFVTRFESFIDEPTSTAWQRSTEAGRVCEPWRVERKDSGFTFIRDSTENNKRTKVHSEVQFAYDAKCKRVSGGGRSTTWGTPGSNTRGMSQSGNVSGSLAPAEREDAFPFSGTPWFYTRRACERSPRD